MKSIQEIKQIYFEKLWEIYGVSAHNKPSVEIEKLRSECLIVAETQAHMKVIIPEEFQKYTINDFNGKSKKNILPKNIALNAKNIVSEYCWGESFKEIKSKFPNKEKLNRYLKTHSFMDIRSNEGRNIVIFGQGNMIGRTMLASIIMKEAIKLRILRNGVRGHTYSWVDLAYLQNEIIKDSPISIDYRVSNWLVVDNIFPFDYMSEKQRGYVFSALDAFFLDRLNSGLPTILVFKFDITEEDLDITKRVGMGISQILQNQKTFKVPLTEKLVK
ncbi:MAG: hypothetical protein WC942_10700 [Clostridia bacterium]